MHSLTFYPQEYLHICTCTRNYCICGTNPIHHTHAGGPKINYIHVHVHRHLLWSDLSVASLSPRSVAPSNLGQGCTEYKHMHVRILHMYMYVCIYYAKAVLKSAKTMYMYMYIHVHTYHVHVLVQHMYMYMYVHRGSLCYKVL